MSYESKNMKEKKNEKQKKEKLWEFTYLVDKKFVATRDKWREGFGVVSTIYFGIVRTIYIHCWRSNLIIGNLNKSIIWKRINSLIKTLYLDFNLYIYI